jgi:CheY-like chemotaxis protein
VESFQAHFDALCSGVCSVGNAVQVAKGEKKWGVARENLRTLDKDRAFLEATRVNRSQTQTATVLIVDDDEEIRHVLRLLFEGEGMEVVGEAANGVEAVTFALKHQPDFVILDYRLPRLDGEGASEILRAIAPTSRIVAFSALLDSKPPWADAFLNKDRISELMPLLRTFL